MPLKHANLNQSLHGLRLCKLYHRIQGHVPKGLDLKKDAWMMRNFTALIKQKLRRQQVPRNTASKHLLAEINPALQEGCCEEI